MRALLSYGLGLLVLQAVPAPIDEVRGAVAEAYQRRALPPPVWDPELAAVASEIADAPGAQLGGTIALRARLQAHGLGDPAPTGLLLQGGSAAELIGALQRSLPPDLEPATLFGAGLSSPQGGHVRLVILRVRRKAVVSPIPRTVGPSEPVQLRGRLLGALKDPTCHSEAPDGTVTQLPTRIDGPTFEAAIQPRSPGRYVLEVMAEGPGGPEMVWIRELWVGEPPAGPPGVPAVAPDASAAPEEQVLKAINRERARQGEPALALDAKLSEIARAYSQELAELKALVHRSPRSGDLISRLRRAGYGFQRAGENLGEGPTVIEAHELIAASPAHRRNLIDPNFDRCGIGVAASPGGTGPMVLTEIFAGGDAPP